MWSFLNPAFLWALSAAALPLILHLLARQRTVRMPFSTLRFLKLAQKQSSSRIKMENFLLWLTRTVLLLVLALAFALPVVRSAGFGGFMGRSHRDVAIVWDTSFSMGYESGRKKVWDDARAAVRQIVEGLSAGDRVSLFLATDEVVPLISEPNGDLEFAKGQVKAVACGTGSSQLEPALAAACDSLKNSGRRERELYVVSDGQALPWAEFQEAPPAAAGATGAVARTNSAAAAAAPAGTGAVAARAAPAAPKWNPKAVDPNITFFVALLGVAAPENIAPMKIEVQPSLVMAGAPARVAVTLGYSGPPKNVPVSLFVDDKEAGRQDATIEAGRGESLLFALPPLGPGPHAARVETPPDGLMIDNAFHFVVRAKEKLPVLCVGGSADLAFLTRALNPNKDTATVDVKEVTPEAFAGGALEAYAGIFLCNALPLPGQGLLDIEQYVRHGGLVAVFPGNRGTAADYGTPAFRPGAAAKFEDLDPGARRHSLRLLQPQDPVFASLKLPPGSVPTLAIQRQMRWELLDKSAVAIVGTDDNTPFLLAQPFGAGRAVMFSVSADRSWSNLPLSPFFLPILHQLVQFGAGLGKEPLFVWTARDLSLIDALPEAGNVAELSTPSKTTLLVRRIKRDNLETLHVENVGEPGIYTAAKAGAPAPLLMAVNVPRGESNLLPLEEGDPQKLLALARVQVARDRDELARQVEEHRVGRPLGETLLWLVFLLASVELFLANRASRQTAKLTETMTVDASGRVQAGG